MIRWGIDKKIAAALIAVVFLGSVSAAAYFYGGDDFLARLKNKSTTVTPAVVQKADKKTEEVAEQPTVPVQPVQPKNVVKETIKKEPPKQTAPNVVPVSTTKNPDGGETIAVGGDCPELNNFASRGSHGSLPTSIGYSDQTQSYPELGNTLKDYMKNNFLLGSEIGSMHQITLQNAGDTKWEGQYCASYTMASNGDIVSSYSYIILNSFYHKDSPNFVDYMKLVLSHEYGHHYTLYHKWVDLDSPIGVRFPDSYYSTRPLSKSGTATDYSLGWNNCEVEIIAEDYSYIYSGYGYHAMSSKYGYPASGISSWLQNIGGQGAQAEGPTPDTTPDTTPPQVSITEPAEGASLSGTVNFKADSSDNVAVSKVSFYVNDNLVSEDSSSPYEHSLNTTAYPNGQYTLRAVATDGAQSANATVTVTFSNAFSDLVQPTVNIIQPNQNPYSWISAENILNIRVRTEDNIGVTNIKLYINDSLALEVSASQVNATWGYDTAPAGTYILKAVVQDGAGNMAETQITVNKS